MPEIPIKNQVPRKAAKKLDDKKDVISALMDTKSDNRFFQLKLIGYNPLFETSPTVRLFFEEGSNGNIGNNLNVNYREECEQPNYQARSEWCDTSECIIFEGDFTEITHLVVHHSAGTNESNDWAAVVRSIWHYHVDIRNWSDIGYNWLIAPNGVIFEGRLDNFVGAHFCGNNGGTMGVCLLGNYENDINLNDASRNALVSLLAWKSFEQSIDPLEVNYHESSELYLNAICGHQDGCQTLCPGQNLYSELDSIRNQVNIIMENCDPNRVDNKVLFDCQLINTLASNYLRIELDQHEDVNYWITDINGSRIHQLGRLLENRINILDLVPGLYILCIASDGKSKGFKFIKLSN